MYLLYTQFYNNRLHKRSVLDSNIIRFSPAPPQFVSLSEEANLKLHLVHISLVPFVWSGDLPGLNLDRVHDLMTTSPEALPPSARHLLQLLEQQNAARVSLILTRRCVQGVVSF